RGARWRRRNGVPRPRRGWRTRLPARRAGAPQPPSCAQGIPPRAASIARIRPGPPDVARTPARRLESPPWELCAGAVFGCRTAAVELPGDLLTPFGVFCLLDQQQPEGGDAFLFEGALGRYSYVGVGGNSPRRLTIPAERRDHPLDALRAALDAVQAEKSPDLPPF